MRSWIFWTRVFWGGLGVRGVEMERNALACFYSSANLFGALLGLSSTCMMV